MYSEGIPLKDRNIPGQGSPPRVSFPGVFGNIIPSQRGGKPCWPASSPAGILFMPHVPCVHANLPVHSQQPSPFNVRVVNGRGGDTHATPPLHSRVTRGPPALSETMGAGGLATVARLGRKYLQREMSGCLVLGRSAACQSFPRPCGNPSPLQFKNVKL